MINIKLVFLSLPFMLFPNFSSATVLTLYDDTQTNLPNNQQWLSYFATGSVTTTATADGVNMQTDNNAKAGFSNYPALPFGFKNPAFPALDSNTGFTLSFSMQLNNEQHISNYRSGFNVILLDKNSQGVELGFWQDSIWSQSDSPLFQAKDEQVSFNTSNLLISYNLTLFDNNFFLAQDDNLLLTGDLKDYSAFSGGPLGSIPYSLSSYLFLGDNSSSALADVTLGRITLSDTPQFIVPLPPSIGFMCLGLMGLFRYKKSNASNT